MQAPKDIHTHTHTTIVFDIPIMQKLYDFYVLLYQYLRLFPKKDRYSLGQKLDKTTLDVLESLFLIPKTKGPEKISLLARASAKLEVLKVFVRLAKDTQTLDNKKYLQLEQMLVEVGKMLGGWIRASQERELLTKEKLSSDI